MIVRPYYLDLLKTYRDVPLVKILAGIRRCGKSTILEMLKKDLIKDGVSSDRIITMRYTSEDFDDGMTDKDMYNGIKEKMIDSGRYYLLLDEVQEISGWEKAVNSLLENANTDIYVTGSNSKLMSSEIIHLSDGTVHLHPCVYAVLCGVYGVQKGKWTHA